MIFTEQYITSTGRAIENEFYVAGIDPVMAMVEMARNYQLCSGTVYKHVDVETDKVVTVRENVFDNAWIITERMMLPNCKWDTLVKITVAF